MTPAASRDAVAETEDGAFGPFALYVGGTGEVRFKDVSHKDLQPRVAQPEKVSTRFRMQTAERVLLLVGSCRRRLQPRRHARHRGRAVLLPRSRLQQCARNLHWRDDRSRHAVLQRAAVRLRLHGRRMAGCAECGVPAACDSVCESQRRVAPVGDLYRHRPHVVRVHAAQRCRRRRHARVPLQGQREQVRVCEARSARIRRASWIKHCISEPGRGRIMAWVSAMSTAMAVPIF